MSIHKTLLPSLLAALALLCCPAGASTTTTTQSAPAPQSAPATSSTLSTKPTTASAAAATTVTAAAKKMVGFWVRADSDPSAPYVIQVKSVGDDGKLDAAYYNPRPINVSRAELSTKDGKAAIYVEMRDRNYPGSNYNLVFHEAEDALVGKYFQAVQGETYDVAFTRMKK